MPITHLTDFSDRLSPMLVKELRQGMRARGFTMLFLTFQGLLGFILLFAGSATNSEGAGTFASGVIFTLFIIASLIFQPMRGVNALSSEITGNTIEMMVLTRLSARRIVLGKWFAIVSQTALVLTSIIPYLVLRYFFGGMVLVGEMVFLALIFLTSMAVTAVMVGASGTATKLVRILPILGFIYAAAKIPDLLFRKGFNSFMSFCTLADWESRATIISYLALIGYIGWCALSHGISAIAPSAENHSTVRRIVALALALITAGVAALTPLHPNLLLTIFAIILFPAAMTALTEPSVLLPPICKPFVQRGKLGRLASVILLPGWPSGVFFTVLLLVIGIATVLLSSRSSTSAGAIDLDAGVVALSVCGGVLLPALLSAFFSRQESKRFTNFLIFLLASILLTIIPAIIAGVYSLPKLHWAFIWNPLVFIPMLSERSILKEDLLDAVCVVDFVIAALLLLIAIRAFLGYREVVEETEKGLSKPTDAFLPEAIES